MKTPALGGPLQPTVSKTSFMARDTSDTTPIESRNDLLVGTEHEKFPFYLADQSPVPYDGDHGIRALLEGMQTDAGWQPIFDGEALIGLFDDRGGAISLEPGGQFELSGAPLASAHDTAAELTTHLALANQVAERHGIGFLGLGMSPLWTLAETPKMPKSRYKIMTGYMPKVGTRGLDMMYRTCTVQTNLDFTSEADMVKKLRVSLALQPLTTALFANSPFTEGKTNGRLSERSEIWRDTDNQRAGMLPFVFEEGFGFDRYVDYALQVPMYFVKRGDIYHDVAGADFRDLMAGTLEVLPGERATVSDWANHLSTIFPEVRLKRFLEMRGADMGSADHVVAMSALYFGLLYDASALDGAWEIVRRWSATERQRLRDDVPQIGLNAQIAGRSLRDIGRDVLALAREGLQRRAKRDAQGRDEGHFLDLLDHRVETGRTAAQDLIAEFNGPWKHSVLPIFAEARL